ncbi:tetratricopeptide repeat protein [uncultured Nostoc sp.]|uniref:tetratricopeptide repeat protein n=1 Tax=uncultured Nostoc sp. TaxID=340711 RepID=UPI0035CB6A97
MPLNFTFALSQQQTFELRCDYGSRRLDKTELAALIDLCEQNYYAQDEDRLPDLTQLGQQLYRWLDGKEGWLRRALDEADEQTILLDLIKTSEAQGLNPETERVALGLAHLPWELLHDGAGFLLQRQNISVLPVRSVQQRQTPLIDVQNRPLRLLFMATSPEDPIVAPLGFEREEANILQATENQPLALIVEESGSVAELSNLVQSYSEDYFDIFHLTGHGIIYTHKDYGYLMPKGTALRDNTPCFITEDEVGNIQLTTVKNLAEAFSGRWPRVTFLSGCHTGQVSNKGTVPSMAQALVKAGAGIVLGWARPVYDRTGIVAAQALYLALATGATVEQAVKAAQQKMIEEICPDWHLLRMYRDTRPIKQLVTPLNTKNREKLKFAAPEQEFLDENKQVKVASRFEFVGRRRPLQRCLKALRETNNQIVGVFIAGMGGLGKSTLAARLCTRVQAQRPNFVRVVLIGPLDEIGLLNKLSDKYQRFADVPALLNEPKVSLEGRLQNFFEAIEKIDQPLLLVLDDFEQNIPKPNIKDGSLRMTTDAYKILGAICAALAETGAESRLIVTCRYLKADTLPEDHRLHLESLAGMSSSDIDKICFSLDKKVKQQLRTQRIIHIADGNPRLLKWLLEVIQQPGIATDELLNRLEATEQKFREDILAQTLLAALEPEEQKFLARLSVFHLPVTEEIIRAISPAGDSKSPTNSESPLKRAEDLGEGISSPLERTSAMSQEIDFLAVVGKLVSLSLVESATTHANQSANYRVTTILESLLETVLSEEEWQAARQQAVREVYKIWWEQTDQKTEAEGLEIVRLGLLAKEQGIAVTIGYKIANRWVNNSRFVEALELCKQILQVYQDYLILRELASAERVLGFVQEAVAHYQQALDLCPEEKLQEKAATLDKMAGVIADQGDIARAIALYEQSLEIIEQIGDVKGKATVLSDIAGVIADQGNIARAIALYEQSLEIKEQIGDVKGKAATFNNMAQVIAQQGDIARAIALYEQSLEIFEQIGDVKGKATILGNMAQVIAQQGDIARAIALYEQDLEISEQVGDVKGRAATLNNMAQVIAQQGNIARAITLYEQSLEISEQIGDVKNKATTLANMAYWVGETGDKARQLKLNLKAALALGRVHAYVVLVRVLNNLGVTDESNGLVYLAQAIWLTLRIQAPLADTILLIHALYNRVPQGDELEALLGTTAMLCCNRRGQVHSQLAELQERSFEIISEAASTQGIDTQEAFDAWFAQQRLNDPEYFFPRLNQRLEEIVGDGWLFDRSQVSMSG